MGEISIDRPIGAKIDWAQNCCEAIKGKLLRDEKTTGLLEEVKEATRASQREMAEVGIVGACRHCEEREGGSCCAAGLENRYSGVLLLINLLLGARIPEQRSKDSSCFFLGKEGCLLLARHVICVNYLCKKITDRIGPEALSALREKEGVELERLFVLEERIRMALKAQSPGPGL